MKDMDINFSLIHTNTQKNIYNINNQAKMKLTKLVYSIAESEDN